MHQMVWDAVIPEADLAFAAVPLGPQHVPQMLELVALRPPGPFAARTRELGDYYGVIEGGRLVAMAGERMAAGAWHEISGVCTHPDVEGRGLAWRLIAKLVRSQMQRGETPFLHVMSDNVHARRLYERMGFRFHQEVAVRVVSRL
jgi:GNAT superfamily N-acetyltransferase